MEKEQGIEAKRAEADGELEDSGADWTPLVKLFEVELGNAPESLSIIWP